MTDKDLQYRVWWIPQIPGNSFYAEVESVVEAKKIMKVLADYDLFQYENKIKPDYANTGGVQVFEEGEWVDLDEEEWFDWRED